MSDGITKLVAAKLALLIALEDMIEKGTWVTWPDDGTQYFVIKPDDFCRILDPNEAVFDAEDELDIERKRKAEIRRLKAHQTDA